MDALQSEEEAVIHWQINQFGYFGDDLRAIRSYRYIPPGYARAYTDELRKMYHAWLEFGSANKDPNRESIFYKLLLEIGSTYNHIKGFLPAQSQATRVSELIAEKAMRVIV